MYIYVISPCIHIYKRGEGGDKIAVHLVHTKIKYEESFFSSFQKEITLKEIELGGGMVTLTRPIL